jgi:hypothetical protein
MMFMLLQVLQLELEDGSLGEDIPTDEFTSSKHRERVTPVMRRILPAVRQYSLWLVSQVSLIVAPMERRGTTDIHIKELWKLYAGVLTQLITVFPLSDFKSVGYLLEEDENIVGFKPLWSSKYPEDCNPYYDHVNHQLKARVTDRGIERHLPAMEMQSRIRDIVFCGLVLQSQDQYPNVPMTVRDRIFVCIEEGLPMVNVTSSTQSVPASPPQNNTAQINNPPELFANSDAETLAVPAKSIAASDSHASVDDEMVRFVDNLTDPSNKPSRSNETSYGMNSLTANEVFCTPSGRQHHSRVRSIPKAFPSLPGLGSKTWTPKPDELNYSSSATNFGSSFSPRGVGTPNHQATGQSYVSQGVGYGNAKHHGWDRSPSIPNSPTSNQYSHEKITPSALSSTAGWGEDSSIYANASDFGRPRRSGVMSRTAAVLNNGNDSTYYSGAIDYYDTEMDIMMHEPIAPIGSQRHKGPHSYTPPAGQGDQG